jgi:hypothetical protein
MKFNKDIVVSSETMNRNEVFCGRRDMENITKLQLYIWGINKNMTNITNTHTCPVCCVNLLMTVILALHGEFVKFTGDVVGGAEVTVPVGVDAICHVDLLLILFFIIFGVAVPTVDRGVACLATDLTDYAVMATIPATAMPMPRPSSPP